MTAYREGVPYVLGVATSVQTNTKEEMGEIARAFNVDANEIWRLPSVQ